MSRLETGAAQTVAQTTAETAALFAALGDPTRLSILTRLSDGRSRSIADLSADTDITRQGITKHLHVLENAGLVSSRRIGRESHFAFRSEPLGEMRAYLDGISEHWDDALSRLARFVEES